MKIFSFGGGRQTTAALVLAAQRKIDYRTFVFANVGDDSENPATLEYLAQYARPYAERNGLEIVEVRRTWNDGRQTTLREYIDQSKTSVPIPAYMAGGARQRCRLSVEQANPARKVNWRAV